MNALRRVANMLLDDVVALCGDSIELDGDCHWSILRERVYNPYAVPPSTSLTLGQLSSDLEFVARCGAENHASAAWSGSVRSSGP